jgi:hypothetical protein
MYHPWKPESHVGNSQATKITMFESGEQTHDTCNLYHLYRKAGVKGGKPWIKLTSAFHERSNLSTGASVRTIRCEYHTNRKVAGNRDTNCSVPLPQIGPLACTRDKLGPSTCWLQSIFLSSKLRAGCLKIYLQKLVTVMHCQV